jgi:hypothetical protein
LHVDSVNYFIAKARLWHLAGDSGKAQSMADSGLHLLKRRGAERETDAGVHGLLAWAHATLGHRTEAVREAKRMIELLPIAKHAYDGAHVSAAAAAIYAVVGEPDLALQEIERLLSVPSPISIPALKTEPVWRSLRNNPRFERLVAAK